LQPLTYERLEKLKQTHATLRLLRADNCPLILSFLYQVFIQPNRRSIRYSELLALLDDYLYRLQEVYGEEKHARSPKAYLEEWCSDRCEYLRQYYIAGQDEPEFDLTPASEKAIEWLVSLDQRQFIGTESRLLSFFQFLREIDQQTKADPQLRLADLEQKKAAIEEEIKNVRAGIVSSYDERQIKERFMQAEETARKLLSDFRQVEENFRTLDRLARERIATSDKNKGALLDEIFLEQDIIRDSDQGKSFKAFWEFLMSPDSQDELKNLLKNILALEEIQTTTEHNSVNFLQNIQVFLLDAGDKVYHSNSLLAEQLRKFLDNHTYLENKRLLNLIKSIEKKAIEMNEIIINDKAFSNISELAPNIELILSRTLFLPPKNPLIKESLLKAGEVVATLSSLFEQNYIDEHTLLHNISQALQELVQISLKDLIILFPIRKGLAEIITYLHIASKCNKAVINNNLQESIIYTVKNSTKCLTLPQIIFLR
jgi:hypothetical protein